MREILEFAQATVCQNKIRETVERICQYDRYQASDGILAAAHELADILTVRENLTPTFDLIDIGNGPAWDFDMPNGWTPVHASMVLPNKTQFTLVDHPCLIAANSVGISRRILEPRMFTSGGWSRSTECIAIVPPGKFDLQHLISEDVKVFTTCVSSLFTKTGHDARGRIELPPTLDMTGFSLDHHQYQTLAGLAVQDQAVTVEVDISRSTQFPVLSWSIEGEYPGEIWIMAHLCHQKPGANDNASGVAGLVEVSRVCKEWATVTTAKHRRTIRFISGPEFTGIAAYLWQHRNADKPIGKPSAVLNLDMIGQDTALSGGNFRLERCPHAKASPLTAVSEHMISQCFEAEQMDWAPMPFKGYSDNSVFAAGSYACPTVQFCHDRDMFNHSSADQPYHLSFQKLSGVSQAAAATTVAMALETSDAKTFRKNIFETWTNLPTSDGSTGALERDLDEYPNFEKMSLAPNEAAAPILRGPLNLRGLLQRVDPETRTHYMSMLARRKDTYAAVLNAVIFVADGQSTIDAVARAVEVLDIQAPPEMTSVVLNVVDQIVANRPTTVRLKFE